MTMKQKHLPHYSLHLLTAALTALTAQATLAATTTLHFDGLSDGLDINSTYAAQGIKVTGATALIAAGTPWPSHSGANIAFSGAGSMSFLLDSSIVGGVKTVSAFISDETSVGLYAYDSNGVLVGQSATAGAGNNLPVSVTTSGSNIASVVIHNGGSTFAVDDITFISAPRALAGCRDQIQQIATALNAIANSDFKSATQANLQKAELNSDIRRLVSMYDSGPLNALFYAKLIEVFNKAGLYIKPTQGRMTLLNMIFHLGVRAKSNRC